MIRGDGSYYDSYYTKDSDGHNTSSIRKNLYATSWPTIDEMLEATEADRWSTYLQILSGQALYFGYECETHCDNDISLYSNIEFKPINLMTDETKEKIIIREKIRKRRVIKVVLQLARFRNISISEAEMLYDNTNRLMGIK